jgi:ferric-chelate reductase
MSHQPTTSSYYYLYQPFRFCGWESHPFTLGAWNYEDDQRSHVDATLPVSDEEIHSSKLPLLSVSASPHRRDTYPTEDKPSSLRPKLIFWIRPYNGWTRHLRDQCLASATNNISPTILLEGPYGQSFPLWKYDSILLIAGGTGIACAVPYIQDHLRRGADKDDDYKDSERLILNKISLVWAAREAAFVHDVGSQELRDALSRDEFEASFYVTAAQSTSIAQATTTARVHPTPSSSTSSSSSSNDYNAAHDMIFSPLNIHHGRPDLQNIVLQHAQEAHDSDSSVAIVVSGPNAMADEVRTAVYLAMRKGYRGITFHEESFSW